MGDRLLPDNVAKVGLAAAALPFILLPRRAPRKAIRMQLWPSGLLRDSQARDLSSSQSRQHF